MPWLLVLATGFVGAIADIIVNNWSRTNKHGWWILAGLSYLFFMTGLGLIVRKGITGGYSLTVSLIIVVLVNVVFVAMWDIYCGTQVSTWQWIGVILALVAVVCFELGRV